MKLLNGLEQFGLKALENLEIYDKPKKIVTSTGNIKNEEVTEDTYIFDKQQNCSLCNHEFTSKTVRVNKAQLKKIELDLRPVYKNVDILKYGVVSCPKCGYTALSTMFKPLMSSQEKAIKSKISSQYKYDESFFNVPFYTYEHALRLYQLALINAIVKNGYSSEKAYISLRIAWLMRGEREELISKSKMTEELKKTIKVSIIKEIEYLKLAFDGFMEARMKESFPIFGMDESTLDYLIAALGYKTNNTKDCLKLLGNVITSKSTKQSIKNQAIDLKELLKEK